MFSKRASKELNDDPNSFNKIGKKVSQISLKNIAVNNNNTLQNSNINLNQLNPKLITKNVDIYEFLTNINEANKTLESISIIVNSRDSLSNLSYEKQFKINNSNLNKLEYFENIDDLLEDIDNIENIEEKKEFLWEKIKEIEEDEDFIEQYGDLYNYPDLIYLYKKLDYYIQNNDNQKDEIIEKIKNILGKDLSDKQIIDSIPLKIRTLPLEIYEYDILLNQMNIAHDKLLAKYNSLDNKNNVELSDNKNNVELSDNKNNVELSDNKSIDELKDELNKVDKYYNGLEFLDNIYDLPRFQIAQLSKRNIIYEPAKVIQYYQNLYNSKDEKNQTQTQLKNDSLKNLKLIYGDNLTDEEIINKIPDNINELAKLSENEYTTELKKVENERNKLQKEINSFVKKEDNVILPKENISSNISNDNLNEDLNKIEDSIKILNNNSYLYDYPNSIALINKFKILNKNKNGTNPGEKSHRTQSLKAIRDIVGQNKTDNEIINMIPINIDNYPNSKENFDNELKKLQKQKESIINQITILNEKKNIKEESKNIKEESKNIKKESKKIKNINKELIEETKKIKDSYDLISKEPIINIMYKFNAQMNKILLIFKSKIKPNLKIIDKKDIQDSLNDMDILNQNFKDIYIEINNKYQNVFGIEKFGIHKKADQFLETWASNFNKISSEITSNLKSYSNISGGLLMSNFSRSRMHVVNKYLL